MIFRSFGCPDINPLEAVEDLGAGITFEIPPSPHLIRNQNPKEPFCVKNLSEVLSTVVFRLGNSGWKQNNISKKNVGITVPSGNSVSPNIKISCHSGYVRLTNCLF